MTPITSFIQSAVGGCGLEFAWISDCGQVRQRNEDTVAVLPELGLALVADGIGGARAGDVASALAASTIIERYRDLRMPHDSLRGALQFLEAAIHGANRRIWLQGRESPEQAGMGSTIVTCVAGRDWLAFAHVGDSRLYRLRDGLIEQLSRDHSLVQHIIDQGIFASRAEARLHGIGENILSRALGSGPTVEVDCASVDLAPGDIYLLCSDGLTGMLPDAEIAAILTDSAEALGDAAKRLIECANLRGGRDNITLALLRVGSPTEVGTAA